MIPRPLLPAIVVACLASLPLPSRATDVADPRAVVDRFLAWEHRTHPSGVNGDWRSAEIDALLSGELQCLLSAATVANDLSIHTAPDEKPPFVEGNVFLPLAYEHPVRAATAPARFQGARATVRVRFGYEGGDEPQISTFVLKRSGGAWRIVDIDRGGTCDFCQRGSLTKGLQEALRAFPGAHAQRCKGH